ncbi:LLM class flavin-dependent oxidoreductase, partial [Amycolatopsis mediterranei]
MLKIRLGVAPAAGTGPAEFAGLAERLEDAGVDSLWLSELVYSPEVDPMIGMAHALARTAKLKVGTGVAILPG